MYSCVKLKWSWYWSSFKRLIQCVYHSMCNMRFYNENDKKLTRSCWKSHSLWAEMYYGTTQTNGLTIWSKHLIFFVSHFEYAGIKWAILLKNILVMQAFLINKIIHTLTRSQLFFEKSTNWICQYPIVGCMFPHESWSDHVTRHCHDPRDAQCFWNCVDCSKVEANKTCLLFIPSICLHQLELAK